jgi:hypothetical protein
MSKVVLYMSMSVDGFITGPDDGKELVRALDGPAVQHLRYRLEG